MLTDKSDHTAKKHETSSQLLQHNSLSSWKHLDLLLRQKTRQVPNATTKTLRTSYNIFFFPYLCMLGIINITSLDTAICLIFAWKSNRHPLPLVQSRVKTNVDQKKKKKKEKESRPMSIIYMQSINIWNSNRPHIFCIQNNRAPFTPIVIILEFQNNQKVDRNMKQHSYIMSYSSKPTSINHLASKLFIVWPSFPLNAFTKKLIAISGPINATNWNSFQYVHWI